MTKQAATEIVSRLSRWQCISLRVLVEEQRLGSFTAGCVAVLGRNYRAHFETAAGRELTDAELRAFIVAHVVG